MKNMNVYDTNLDYNFEKNVYISSQISIEFLWFENWLKKCDLVIFTAVHNQTGPTRELFECFEAAPVLCTQSIHIWMNVVRCGAIDYFTSSCNELSVCVCMCVRAYGLQWKKKQTARAFPPSRLVTVEAEGCVIRCSAYKTHTYIHSHKRLTVYICHKLQESTTYQTKYILIFLHFVTHTHKKQEHFVLFSIIILKRNHFRISKKKRLLCSANIIIVRQTFGEREKKSQ